MNAKRFFFVCASILVLVIASHRALPDARGSVFTNQGAAVDEAAHTAIATNGDVYTVDPNTGLPPWTFKGNVFGGQPAPGVRILFIDGYDPAAAGVAVILENGDMYNKPAGASGGLWTFDYSGNIMEQFPGRGNIGSFIRPHSTNSHGTMATIIASGDVFVSGISPGENYRGNIFGATVGAERKSWGAVKDAYRK